VSGEILLLALVVGPIIGFVGLMTALGWIAMDWRRPVSRA
jgi:hypothetical protein